MIRIKLPSGKGLKTLIVKHKRFLLLLAGAALIALVVWAAWPWLKEKQIIPVADDERRSPLYASRNEKEYSELMLKNLQAQQDEIKSADTVSKYEYYAEKANELTMLERYDEAEQAYLAAEKTGQLTDDPARAEAFYTNFGMMYEAKGDDAKAHEMYQKAADIIQKMDLEPDMKRIRLEDMKVLLDRTKGWL